MTEISRRGFMAAGLGAAYLAQAGMAFGQAFPSKQFTLACGYAPGGLADIIARLVSGYLGRTFPQPSIVENRPGANGALAWEAVAKQPADGYHLLVSTQSQIVLLPATTPSLKLDPIDGLTHIAMVCESPYLLWASADFQAQTFDELVKLGKSGETPIFYGTSGIGGQQHLASELLALETGIKMQAVHYKGGGVMMPDLMSNRVQLGFATPALALGAYKEGRIKPLLAVGDTEDPNFPGVPASTQVGLPRMKSLLGWYGIQGPAGIPDDIADSLNKIVQDCLSDPDIMKALELNLVNPVKAPRKEFADRIAEEYGTIQDLVKAIGFTPA